MSTRWTFIREIDGEFSIGKNGFFYNNVAATGIDNTIHAIQWNGVSGEIEKRDATTGLMTANESITSLDSHSYVETNWNSARASHKSDWTAQYISDQALHEVVVTQSEADAAFELAYPVPT